MASVTTASVPCLTAGRWSRYHFPPSAARLGHQNWHLWWAYPDTYRSCDQDLPPLSLSGARVVTPTRAITKPSPPVGEEVKGRSRQQSVPRRHRARQAAECQKEGGSSPSKGKGQASHRAARWKLAQRREPRTVYVSRCRARGNSVRYVEKQRRLPRTWWTT